VVVFRVTAGMVNCVKLIVLNSQTQMALSTHRVVTVNLVTFGILVNVLKCVIRVTFGMVRIVKLTVRTSAIAMGQHQ
jgi:hypothetical protein